MLPAVRAIADRVVLDTANLKYIAAILPDDALQRRLPEGDWTVHDLFAHFAATEELHADISERFLAGGEGYPAGFQIDAFNAEAVAEAADASLAALIDRFEAARARLLAGYERLTASQLTASVRERTLRDALDGWSRHYARHAMDLLDVVPEIRFDTLVLNWVLHADLRGHPSFERQRRLFEEVRELAEKDD